MRFTPAQCNLCQSPDVEVKYQITTCEIRACRSCGLVYTAYPEELSPADLYTAAYFQGGMPDGYADYQGSERVLRAEFRRVIHTLRQYAGSRRHLLEIGAAYGFLLDEARPYFEAWGIEISPVAADMARQRGHTIVSDPVSPAVFHQHPAPECVVMLDTIEHLPDPAAVLADLHAGMAPGGLLYITTGDMGSILARVMGRHWRLMTPPQHLYFFSRKTLIRLLTQTGFTVFRADRPWKIIPIGLAFYQVLARAGIPWPRITRLQAGIPVNLFDTLRIIAQKS